MIWPVSDCPDPVELIVIPGYHTGSPRGYVAVQTPTFFAWWSDLDPARSPDGGGPADWLELALDASLELASTGDPLGAATEPWTLPDSTPKNLVVRGDRAAISWQRRHEADAVGHTVVAETSYNIAYPMMALTVFSGKERYFAQAIRQLEGEPPIPRGAGHALAPLFSQIG